ncbi:MAG: NfeD family protein [Syntrophomonadaceae bacterium]|jgi:membrane protein implicated in regulation of membrane protease activity
MTTLQWILVAVVTGAVEILTAGLWFLWFTISALIVALGVSLAWLTNLESQLLVFALLTTIFILFTRPLVLKFIKSNDTVSNVNALIGQHGITLSPLAPLEYGQVKVNGEVWTAVSSQEIDTGTRVSITAIDGVKLVVEKSD